MTTISKHPQETQDSKNSPGKKPRKQEAPASLMEQLTTYLKGVRSEWGKISWPTRPQIWGQTIVVLAMVSVMTLCLFALDYLFHFIITSITPHRS
ncbi:MAG: SecE/Sec61-gamma subunit of protein translocation complex [Vampirovibrio sp.]|jgi:preprotein translocase subunit SecE|nr:SecE/Sec61-gamma subunit of protein translocation complex [Vampirovibrio sp.]